MDYQPLASRNRLVSQEAKQKYIEEYFLMYPGIKEYMEVTKGFLQKNGYVKTLLGRKINIKDYNSKNPMIKCLKDKL